jgi:hypothetical protein
MTRIAVFALAFGGVLLGHAVTYAGLAPSAMVREAMLTATGHGYLSVANRFGLLVALGALAGVFLGGLTRSPRSVDQAGPTTTRLVAFQLLAFSAMEIAERLGSGAGAHDLVRVLPAGLVIQVGIALAVAAAVRWLLRTADRVASWAQAAPTRGRAPRTLAIPASPAVANVLLPAGVGGRAPPRSA